MKIRIDTELDIDYTDFDNLEAALSQELPVIVDRTCGTNATAFLRAFATYNACLEAAGVITESVPVIISEVEDEEVE
ncbi:hypothetical protein [Adlercreutzia sp. ZJ138]|uniref:hypothetical protein n=1 Tax=Adlercreutzia sp. ZJ138 TaxID=2709405 RepID=UPI0013EC9A09|nr:hypothetical protein [Adlercreutzia sp. ZJ138]